jgi:signal peptidase I
VARWKAALLALVSFFLPGLGHALGGWGRRTLWIAPAALVMNLGLLAIQAPAEIGRGLLLLSVGWTVLALGAAIAAAADAWRMARRPEPGAPWRHRLLLAGAAVAPTLLMLALPYEPIPWRSYYVPSASMLPTLPIGDRFVVQEGWYDHHPPRRGDVAVFTLPAAGVDYVKRIIGLPGDTVRMEAGRLILNGEAVPSETLAQDATTGATRELWRLPDGPAVTVLRQHRRTTTPPFHVPEGHVFLIGDNVENSADSRFDPRMRFVPVDALVGRAAIIYWPLTDGRFGRRIQ